jgi:hypothetical protein
VIPPASDAVWQKLVSGQSQHALESLAVKVFLGAARMQLSRDKSPEAVRRLGRELHDVFAKNQGLPSVQNDLAKICK